MNEASPAKMKFEWRLVDDGSVETINGYELLWRLQGNPDRSALLNHLHHGGAVQFDYARIVRIA